jgi:signal transduction histidine kinase
MRRADALTTVGVVSGDSLASGPLPGPVPAALSERSWLPPAVLIACAVLAVLVLANVPSRHDPGQRLILAALLASGPIVLLRRWPLPVLAVVAAAAGLAMASGNAPLPLSIMLGLAMYFVASRLPRRVSIRVAAVAAAVLGAVLVYAAVAGRTANLPGDAVESFLPLAAAWFIGDSVATRRRYLAGLAEQAERERAAETERARQEVREERVRIARELHDVVAHTLTVITVQAGVGRRLMARRPEEAGTALESIEMIGRTAQDELRVVLGLLRDEELGAAALAPAPGLVDLKELAEHVRASGTPVELRTSGADRPLSPALELSIYRVVQEALTNVVKHAPGARATVGLAVSDNQVRIEVADDGAAAGRPGGEDGWPAAPGTGHGIVGMRERIGAFGGWLVAEPLAGRGFRVLAEIPIEGTV